MKIKILCMALILCLCMPALASNMPVFTDDLGDFSFFKSEYITHRYVGYPNLTENLKGNEIVYEKFDYKNPLKGNRIIMKKTVSGTGDNDLYIDIKPGIFSTYRSSKTYRYFKLSGEFLCNFDGTDGTAHIFQLRDSSVSSNVINIYAIKVNTSGGLVLSDGQVINDVAANGKWFSVEMYVNLDTHCITLFVNGKKVVNNKKLLPDNMNKLSLVRIQLRKGAYTGELQCRNMEFTGLDKAYNGKEIRTSMFTDDGEIKSYLADKVCFHYYGKNYYSSGSKKPLTSAPVLTDDDIFVSPEDFNKAFGSVFSLSEFPDTVISAEGKNLVPVGKSAEELLGKHCFNDTNGMIISADYELPFDVSNEVPYHRRKIDTGYIDRFSSVQYIYDFLLFDRPGRDSLLDGFNSVTSGGTAHPRIMADSADFERIKTQMNTDGYLKGIVNNIIAQADNYIKGSPITYKYDDDLRTLNTANKLRDTMFVVGFAYRITGDTKYSDWVWANLSALDGFPDINAGHPIDTGSYGAGIAIGYDWCYDAFTSEQRVAIEANAMRLHLSVIGDGFYGRSPVRGGNDGNINVVGYYNKWISNYNMWTNSGSLMMSLAFMDTYPEQCSDLLWHSIRSLEYTFKNLYPDGAWAESTNYWDVVAQGMTYVYGSLCKIYGTDFGLSRFPGTEKTGITNMSLRGLNGSYNYHDAGISTEYAKFHMGFLGNYFGIPALSGARRATLSQAFDSRMPAASAHPVDALYYDADIICDSVSDLPNVHTARGIELFAVHEDYTDYDGMFFASHGGPVTFYHSHNDNGDFVFDLNGVRWADALPAENYNIGVSSSKLYRTRTEGHNTVTINNGSGFNQQSDTYSPITDTAECDTAAYAVYDMSENYADADSFLRGFFVDRSNRTLTVRDEISLNKENSEVYWFMHTKANVEMLDSKTALLTRNGKSVVLQFDTDANRALLSVMDAVPLASSPEVSNQNANNGYRKIAIRLVDSDDVSLTVRIAEIKGKVSKEKISGWRELLGSSVDAGMTDTGIAVSAYAGSGCIKPCAAVAFYSSGRLAGVELVDLGSGENSEFIAGFVPGADSAKVFLWDGMKPVALSKEIMIK